MAGGKLFFTTKPLPSIIAENFDLTAKTLQLITCSGLESESGHHSLVSCDMMPFTVFSVHECQTKVTDVS